MGDEELETGWRCFDALDEDGSSRRHCARLPEFEPVVRMRDDSSTEDFEEHFAPAAVPVEALCYEPLLQQAAAHFQQADTDRSGAIETSEVAALSSSLERDRLVKVRLTFGAADVAPADTKLDLAEVVRWVAEHHGRPR